MVVLDEFNRGKRIALVGHMVLLHIFISVKMKTRSGEALRLMFYQVVKFLV